MNDGFSFEFPGLILTTDTVASENAKESNSTNLQKSQNLLIPHYYCEIRVD